MNSLENSSPEKGTPLKRGWTTGACATAAAKSALSALLGEGFIDPVSIVLPGGQKPTFALTHERIETEFVEAGIIKDAGDDPDVTHGATIIVRIEHALPGTGIIFRAGSGVGTVTKAGLALPIGEPAINPVPRKMISETIKQFCGRANCIADFIVTISVPGGEEIAKKTWNPRLGIIGGISILGTTGIVIPYSCSAWIHSIHSGIDVARAAGLTHLVGSTGDSSEKAAKAHLGLPIDAFIDMGDFVGGMLKYLRTHRVKTITLAGGFAKMSKLAKGAMDLHSHRSQVDIIWLSEIMAEAGAPAQMIERARSAITGNEVLQIARTQNIAIGDLIAQKAAFQASKILKQTEMSVNVLVIDRVGEVVGRGAADE